MLLLLLLPVALAQEAVSRASTPRPFFGHSVLELRVGADLGASASPVPRPTICAQVNPLARLGFEACGNGGGTFHNDEVPGIMHLRARLEALRLDREHLVGSLLVGAGMTEIQSTADQAGLRFGEAEEGAIEAAGGELSVSAQGRWWVHERTFMVMDLNAGAALIPGAPEVIGQGGPVVPFTSVTAGMGF